jgi:hypothetical protein
MSSLVNRDPSTTFHDLLRFENNNGGLPTTDLLNLEDGLGNIGPFKLSQQAIQFTGLVSMDNALPLNSGGTNASLVADPGAIVYMNALSMTTSTVGTTQQVLKGGQTLGWINYTTANTPLTLVERDALGDFAANVITATSFVGPLTGNVNGNVSGNVIGSLTGDVTGNLTGNSYGTHYGSVDATSGSNTIQGPTFGVHTGSVIGNVTGTVNGNVNGNTYGTHYGSVDASGVGNTILGTFSGTLDGNITGTATNVTGIVAVANGGTGTNTVSNAVTVFGLNSGGVNDIWLHRSGGTMTGNITMNPTYRVLFDDGDFNAPGIAFASVNNTGIYRNTTSGAVEIAVTSATCAEFNATSSILYNDYLITGALTLSGAPTLDLHASTKKYVDDKISALVNGAGTALDTLSELATALGNDANFSTTIATTMSGKLALAGGTMTGALILSGDPTALMGAATKNYVDNAAGAVTSKIDKAGDTMTGLLILSADPVANLGAATKQYTDTKVAKSGDTMTGALTLSGVPTLTNHAATKGYVDGAVWMWSIVTTTTTAVANGAYFVDTTAGGVTVNLPASPVLGTSVKFVDGAGTFATNNLTISRNGLNIMGLAQDLTVSDQYGVVTLTYMNAANGWRIT